MAVGGVYEPSASVGSGRRAWLDTLANTFGRVVDFLRAPAAGSEYALLALFNVATLVVIAGLIWQRDLRAVLVIAGVIGLATRVLDRGWIRISWHALAVSLLVVLIFTTLGLVGGVVLAIDTHHWQTAPAVVPAVKVLPEIHVQPCPSPDETLTQRPDGSYVCLYHVPPAPSTGPVVASPK
jgi:hypothetical protein